MDEHGQKLVAAAIRDITDRKKARAELVAAREAAEEARRLADTSREVAVRANQAKGRFLATASHDLRQPLQSLGLLNGTLRRLVVGLDVREALAHQDQAIEAMSRLLNALLDISKLESATVKPHSTDFPVARLFEELQHEFSGVAIAKGLELQVECSGECVHSDPALVGQILRNLLANAIKYTHRGRVRVSCVHREEAVRIDVLDTGIGITADQLHYIYDEFYQVGVPTNSSRNGYGLGLSIVQRLARLLELRLEVTSELGKGSLFTLELPHGQASGAVAGAVAASEPVTQKASSSQILLVEDDPAVRNATRLLLKVEGYRVLTAGTLAEACSIACAQPQLDLLITDYHLSNGETGTQVIAALRESLGKPLKAVLLTGDTSSAVKELQRDEQLRVTSKPIPAEDLLSLLKALLAQ